MAELLLEQLAVLRAENHELRSLLRGTQHRKWRGIPLCPRSTVVLGLLASGELYASHQLTRALDITFPRQEFGARTDGSSKILIYRLRRVLGKLDPPITIHTEWGVGYFLDLVSAARLAEREIKRDGKKLP